MTDAMAAMLDELMGKTRNANKDEQGTKMDFRDPDVCQFALAGLCPYTLFSNTKSDLGACDWIVHEDHIEYPRLKEEYDAIDDREKEALGYGRKLYRLLFELVQEMDKKIARSQERVDKENQPRSIKPADQVKLDALKQQAKDSTDRAEVLAMEGDADGSMAMTEAAEKFNEEHNKLYTELVMPERTKSVCEVCGVFINSTDNEQRRLEAVNQKALSATDPHFDRPKAVHAEQQDHINGKQYVGWKQIREKLHELEPVYGPSSRSGQVQDRGAAERDADFRRSDSRDRGDRRNGDDRYGDRADRGGRGYDRGDRDHNQRRSGGYERGYARRDEYHGDRGDRGYDRGYDRSYGGRDDRSHARRDEYDRGDRGSDRYGDRGDRGSYAGSRGYSHRR